MTLPLTKTGRYQIVRELGRGAMGVVYQGFDPVIGRTVAIKTMRPEGLSSSDYEEYKGRFQREAQAAGALSHPNIVTVHDFGEDQGVLYLAMEFLKGISLQELVDRKKVLPIETIIPLYEQVSSALDHAHAHQVVHRDIKPANIMLLDSGLAKVTDFGIARVLSSGTGVTRVGPSQAWRFSTSAVTAATAAEPASSSRRNTISPSGRCAQPPTIRPSH